MTAKKKKNNLSVRNKKKIKIVKSEFFGIHSTHVIILSIFLLVILLLLMLYVKFLIKQNL